MSRGGDSEIYIFPLGSFPEARTFRGEEVTVSRYRTRSAGAMWRARDARDRVRGSGY